jgi:alpha-L-rhamnosidase
MYEMTGKTRIMREQYESMKAWCDYVIITRRSAGAEQTALEVDRYLWNTGFNTASG